LLATRHQSPLLRERLVSLVNRCGRFANDLASVPSWSGNGLQLYHGLGLGQRYDVSVPSWSGNGLQPSQHAVANHSIQSFSPLLVGERASTPVRARIRAIASLFQSPLGRGTGFNVRMSQLSFTAVPFQSPLGRGTGFNAVSGSSYCKVFRFQSPLGRGTGFNAFPRSCCRLSTPFQSPLGRGTGFNISKTAVISTSDLVSVPSWSGNGLQR